MLWAALGRQRSDCVPPLESMGSCEKLGPSLEGQTPDSRSRRTSRREKTSCRPVKGGRSIRGRDAEVWWFGFDVPPGRLVLLISASGLRSSYGPVLFSRHQTCDISWSIAPRCGLLLRSRSKHSLPFLSCSVQLLDHFRMPRSVSISLPRRTRTVRHTLFMERLCLMLFCQPLEPLSCTLLVLARNQS